MSDVPGDPDPTDGRASRARNQIDYWDSVAYEKTFTISVDYEQLRRRLSPGARILDYGCGYGRVCGELADAGFSSVIGVDPSREMIRRARELHPDLTFAVVPADSSAD
jgi:2-polyprenyl-3-methyl-5-hydroxy-6-metoxy-1,4-benzoquinol methylase